jgi:toxin-antitoxin system PIN domain toxin
MSYSVDVNLLLYASDRSCKQHEAARTFLDRCAAGPELLIVTWPTLISYLRIATHPSVFAAPLSAEDAFANILGLLSLPHVRAVSELDDFPDAWKQVTKGIVVRGNLVPDAHLAAILYQHGVRTLYSSDRDFHRFASLQVRDPLSAQ